ncbi:MAG: ATP-dependent RNA helicase HrpA [Methylophilaceae bacterium]|nr:ATP-dependent RNA helicase HrpA [Methylophilaceae bacterium]
MNTPLAQISYLQNALSHCMVADQFRLRRRLQQAKAQLAQNKPNEKTLVDLAHQVQISSQKRALRLAHLPKPNYPLALPVSSRRDEIAKAISENQVVIVCGETGSGKTTQLPKICLSLGRGVSGLIGHTQPRRIAARTVASRIAQELDSSLGEIVGYKVRFNEKSSAESYIKLMTDGILLAETQGDRFLNAYDTIIIDEAHERSLNIDFLLGFLKQLLPKRPDLKVIVTSATIDAERFGMHFASVDAKGELVSAPIIEVSGRTYPVEVRYRPLGKAGFISHEQGVEDEDFDDDVASATLHGIQRQGKVEARWLTEDEEEEAIEEAILDAADDLLRQSDGDILVFLPGEREIRDTAEHLRKYQGRSPKLKQVEVLPLFARLSIADQQKIFKPNGQRRIILATNVAETSLTVPGIKYVIDTGLARINRYSARAKVEQLQIEKISQAAAKQRAGRCGRVSNGICVRLYAEDDFNQRPAFTDPEIIRSSLASVILRMAALRLGDVEQFPFLEAPSARLISDGYMQLQELGAVDANRQITDIGIQLARLPLDPRVARMILAAKKEDCLQEVLIIASVISMQDPRERPMDKREAAVNAHAKFAGEGSDFIGFLKIWDWYEQAVKNKQSNKDLLNQCHAHFLSFLRLKEWRELYLQLKEIAEEMDFKLNSKAANDEQIHRALLAGLLGNIGFKDGEHEAYAGARSIRFFIAPGSCLKKTRPKWVMAAELVDTSKLYARCVAKIEPDWIEPLARHLTTSQYSDPRWDRKLAQVSAWEKVSLYGLTVVPKRRVHYGPINVEVAHEIFIREALANMELDTNAPFLAANKRIIAEIEELEHKARRQDVLVDEYALSAFYDKIVPKDIVNGIGFEAWRKNAEKSNPKLLFLTKDDLMRHEAESVTETQFPETITMDGVSIQLKYRFEPGHILDGVTATIPLALLNQMDATRAEWLVPGMLREKVTALIKILPKTFRRVCVPVPDFVTGFLEHAKVGVEPILVALVAYIRHQTQLKLTSDDFMLDKLPEHFFMNFSVIDEKQRELGMGRNWHMLKAQLGNAAQLTFRKGTSNAIEKTGLKQWDFGDLPATLTFTKEGHQLTGYPALVDELDSVSIKLFDTEQAADVSHRAGVCRLMRFDLKEQMKQLQKALPQFNQYALQLRNVISPDDLKEDLISALADRAFVGEDALPRSNAAFMALKQRARTRLPAVKDALFRTVAVIGTEYFALAERQAKMPVKANRLSKDVETQIQDLLYKGCFSQTPWDQLQHLARYLKALSLRIDKQPSNPDRDGKHAASVALLWQKWQAEMDQQAKIGDIPPALQNFRWLIEELRVSLFAQELKTPFPVSIKRLDKIWSDLV